MEVLFNRYVESFDLQDEKIKLKILHTYRVVEIMEYLTNCLRLCERDCFLAKKIALYHDIGRFKQIVQFGTFDDSKSIDHAQLSCEILNQGQFLKDCTEDEKGCILKAIYNHNKLYIGSELNEKEQFFARLIRDADKCDIFKVIAAKDYLTLFGFSKEEIEQSYVSKKVKESLMSHQCVDKKDRKEALDFLLTMIGFFYDLNFEETIEYIMEYQWYRIPFDDLSFAHEETRKDVKMILNEMETYLGKRGNNNVYN